MAPQREATPAEQLAEFCTETLSYDEFPQELVTRTKELLLDVMGVGINASTLESSEVVTDGIHQLSTGRPGNSSVWGRSENLHAEDAAFLNGTYAHSIEMDDTHGESVSHPGAPVIPAAVAAAEHWNTDGETLIEGIVAGYEVMTRLGLALPATNHVKKGFHTTSTCGFFGASTAVAVIVGSSPEELRNALAITINQTAGSRQAHAGELSITDDSESWDKRIHPGLAARSAFLSVSLANSGFQGSREPLTGEFGFLNMYSDNPRPELLTADLGTTYELMRTSLKPYSCCRQFHSSIDATLDVIRESDISSPEVEGITVYCPDRMYLKSIPIEEKTRPQSVAETQFSPQYAIAAAVVDRKVTPQQFDDSRLDDSELWKVMDKINIVEDDDMSSRYPAEWPSKVVVETSRGTFTALRSLPRGDPERMLSSAEIHEKFRALVAPRYGEDQSEKLLETVLAVDEPNGVETLHKQLGSLAI